VYPYNIRAVQQFFLQDQEARSWYQMDFLIQTGVFTDADCFTLNRNVNNCINTQWYSEYLHAFDEVPLYDLKVGVWCAVSACKIMGNLFSKDTVCSHNYVWLILKPFFREFWAPRSTDLNLQLVFVGTTERWSWYRQPLQELKEKLLIFQD
jgi:hypothetical protein